MIRKFTFAVEDADRNALVHTIIDAFERDVVSLTDSLEKGKCEVYNVVHLFIIRYKITFIKPTVGTLKQVVSCKEFHTIMEHLTSTCHIYFIFVFGMTWIVKASATSLAENIESCKLSKILRLGFIYLLIKGKVLPRTGHEGPNGE